MSSCVGRVFSFNMHRFICFVFFVVWLQCGICRDEDKIMKGNVEIAGNDIAAGSEEDGGMSLDSFSKDWPRIVLDSEKWKEALTLQWDNIACYWPNEAYEPCFGGCAEVSCDNPRNHLRPCYPYCEPGCVCEEPYVRDDRTHQCVLPQDCSPTQMGIPVPAKRSPDKPAPKYRSVPRGYVKRAELDDFDNNEVLSTLVNNGPISSVNPKEELKQRGSEVSRMGNYFNIVIAPPPIKALQPRKLIQNEAFRNAAKRMT